MLPCAHSNAATGICSRNWVLVPSHDSETATAPAIAGRVYRGSGLDCSRGSREIRFAPFQGKIHFRGGRFGISTDRARPSLAAASFRGAPFRSRTGLGHADRMHDRRRRTIRRDFRRYNIRKHTCPRCVACRGGLGRLAGGFTIRMRSPHPGARRRQPNYNQRGGCAGGRHLCRGAGRLFFQSVAAARSRRDFPATDICADHRLHDARLPRESPRQWSSHSASTSR